MSPLDDDRDRTPVSVVFEQRERLLRAICALTGLDEHGAEDVLSAVTERVLRNGLAPRDGESWFAYMRDAARNEASNERRTAARAAQREAHAFTLSGADSTVDGVAARMVWLDAMADLDRLPELERRAFWMRYYDDASHAEIAAATGLTLSGVAVRLRQAKERLRGFQQERTNSAPYLLLIALGSTSRRTSVTAPPALACIGATVLSMLAVVAVPITQRPLMAPNYPAIRVVAIPARDVPQRAAGPARGAGAHADASVASPREVMRRLLRPGPRPQLLAVPPLSIGGCAGPACAGTGGGDFGPRGDRITLASVDVSASQAITPACWLLPPNDELRCQSGEPEEYVVPRPGQDPPQAARKSMPSTPAPQETTKGSPP